jgi:repressor LexA
MLMGWENSTSLLDNILPIPPMKRWKVLGGTACGEPIFRELDDESVLAPADIDADFVFRCVGDSMINARIFDGDIVFVKSGVNVENGQIAVVRIGEEYTLKRIYHGPDYLELRAENPMYPAKIIRGEQENAEIVGRATHFLSRIV